MFAITFINFFVKIKFIQRMHLSNVSSLFCCSIQLIYYYLKCSIVWYVFKSNVKVLRKSVPSHSSLNWHNNRHLSSYTAGAKFLGHSFSMYVSMYVYVLFFDLACIWLDKICSRIKAKLHF